MKLYIQIQKQTHAHTRTRAHTRTHTHTHKWIPPEYPEDPWDVWQLQVCCEVLSPKHKMMQQYTITLHCHIWIAQGLDSRERSARNARSLVPGFEAWDLATGKSYIRSVSPRPQPGEVQTLILGWRLLSSWGLMIAVWVSIAAFSASSLMET